MKYDVIVVGGGHAGCEASLITIAPKSAAGVLLNAPPILPIAVRQAPANTTFFAILRSPLNQTRTQ